ncbi:MAG: hypothetical protein Q8R57_02455 [Bacteroidota bacterium]|nr:hypothetical protein [Bacteroidota bacterium]
MEIKKGSTFSHDNKIEKSMNYKLVLAIIILIFNVACIGDTVNNKSRNGSLHKDSIIINKAELLINNYLQNNDGFEKRTYVFSDKEEYTLDLYSFKGKPKILDITSVFKNEYGLIDTFTERFFLGEENNYPIVYLYESKGGESSIQVITKDRDVVSYLKKSDKIIFKNELDSFTKETKISALMFLLINNLFYFDKVKFDLIQKPSLNSMPVLSTKQSNVILYSECDTTKSKVRTLSHGELLFFLDYNKEFLGDHFKAPLWLKVTTEDKKFKGWILGLNENIEFYTDGD